MLETPVLFLIYRRPDKTLKVFNAIKNIKPKKLFVVADGPKNDEEIYLCEQSRQIVSNVDWDCEVKTLFRDKNIGSKYSVSSGINWFFEHVEEGIILEDDCLPNDSFFFFCENMLNRYRGSENILHISGTNLTETTKSKYTYYFSRYPIIWGWATWKRAWHNYDLELEDRLYYKELIKDRFKDPLERRFWNRVLDTLNDLDAWDYQWMFSIWNVNGLCVNTNYNFVTNIGFDESATHTTYSDPYAYLTAKTITEFTHQPQICIDKKAENDLLRAFHNLEYRGYWGYFLLRTKNLFHKIKLLKRKLIALKK
jgi:hypothetical protein